MIFYCETKDSTSDRLKGPIDEKGMTTVHKKLKCEAYSLIEAEAIFEKRFPRNVCKIYTEKEANST